MGTLTSLPGRRKERVAVLLNANASRVNARLRSELERHLPAEDLYWSRSDSDARVIARTVLDRDYDTLLLGGGDGTFVGFANAVLAETERLAGPAVVRSGGAAPRLEPSLRPLPRFGALRLGTGNALAQLTGASENPVGVIEDVLRTRAGDVTHTRPLRLIGTEGRLAPFAGLGLDAMILNDFRAVSRRMGRLGSGVAGYLLAVATRSVPRVLVSRVTPHVRIINEGAPAQQVAPDGQLVGPPIATGEVLFEGPCRVAAVGTVPCYGFGFTMFPHVQGGEARMQLRLTAMPVMEIVRHVPQLWRGRTPRTGVLDFLAERVRVSFDSPQPFQIGGDAEGMRSEVTFALDPRVVQLLDFHPQG